MVLDSRSRTDSSESINGNGANPSNNGSHSVSDNGAINGIYTTADLTNPSTSIPSAPVTKKKSIGKWWQALGLRTKTAVISVVAITIPLLAVGGFTYVYVGQNIANSTRQAKSLRAEGMAYRAAYFMRERYGDIQTLTNLPFLTNPKIQTALTLPEQKAILDN